MASTQIIPVNDAPALLKRIQADFPDLQWQTHKLIQIGWDHEVIQLDDRYIFRFPNSAEYQAILGDEIELMSYLGKRLSARIPGYKYIAKDLSFAGYDMIVGEELRPETYAALPQEDRQKVVNEIAIFLSELHSIHPSDLRAFHVTDEPDFSGYGDVATEAEQYLKPEMSHEDFKIVTKMLDDIAPFQKQAQPARLIHGDIAPKHILWDNHKKNVGFIDFSDRSISDPACDFAELYTYGEEFVETVYQLYSGPDKDSTFLPRAKAYMKAIGIHSLISVHQTEKMDPDEAMKIFKIGADLKR